MSRKGAIEAGAGRAGADPGLDGDRVVRRGGQGRPAVAELVAARCRAGSYSRSAARRQFTHEQLREAMAGIEYRDTDAFIDEIPAAYKDIDQVMADAADLVEVLVRGRDLVDERVGVAVLDAAIAARRSSWVNVWRARTGVLPGPAPCGEEPSATGLPFPTTTYDAVPIEPGIRPS